MPTFDFVTTTSLAPAEPSLTVHTIEVSATDTSKQSISPIWTLMSSENENNYSVDKSLFFVLIQFDVKTHP